MVTITKYSVGSSTPVAVELLPGTNHFVPIHTDVQIASVDTFSYNDGVPVPLMPTVNPCVASTVWALAESGTKTFFLVHSSGC
jgi:hypothetical protein